MLAVGAVGFFFYLSLLLYYFIWLEAKDESNTSVVFKVLNDPQTLRGGTHRAPPGHQNRWSHLEKGKSVHFTWVRFEMCKPDVPLKRGVGVGGGLTGRKKERVRRKKMYGEENYILPYCFSNLKNNSTQHIYKCYRHMVSWGIIWDGAENGAIRPALRTIPLNYIWDINKETSWGGTNENAKVKGYGVGSKAGFLTWLDLWC